MEVDIKFIHDGFLSPTLFQFCSFPFIVCCSLCSGQESWKWPSFWYIIVSNFSDLVTFPLASVDGHHMVPISLDLGAPLGHW